MRISTTGLAALIALAAMCAARPALAQASVGETCSKMKDPIGCICAAATGGTVSAKTWARGPDQPAFQACLSERGISPNANRPATISARR